MARGEFALAMLHLPVGLMLVCAFAMLGARRPGAVLGALATQGAALAGAVLWQGWAQGAPQLWLAALIAGAAQGLLIPLVLRRLFARPPPLARAEEGRAGPVLAMPLVALPLVALALVALALVVALPATEGARATARMELAVALSLVLLGLLMMATRRPALGQAAGLTMMENGILLAAAASGMPFVVVISVAGPVLVAALVAGTILRRFHGRRDSGDAAPADPYPGR